MTDNPAGIEGLSKVAAPGYLVEIVFLEEADFMTQPAQSRQMVHEKSNKSGLFAEMENLKSQSLH